MSSGRGPPPEISGMTSLKVDNLTYRTTPEDLKHAFEKYGDVGDVYIPRDRLSRESRGFAFVRFFHNRDAEDAMESMDGTVVDGRELRVQMAKYGGRPTESRARGPPRHGGRYGGGGDRGRSRRSSSRSRGRRYSRSYSRSRSKSRTPSLSREQNRKGRSKSPSHSRSRSH